MIKYNELRKKTLKIAGMAAAAIAAVAAVYAGFSMILDSVAEQRTSAESTFDADNGLLASLRDQLNKSGEAEKRYVAIQENRSTQAYETDIKALEAFLSNARDRYKFGDLKIKRTTAVVSDKPELANFTFNVQVWNRLRITFKAVSDVHVFSFLEEFRNSVPGFIRVEALEIKRNFDFTDQSLSTIKSSGTMPLNVEAKIEFSWIGLSPKDKNQSPSSTPPAP